MKQGVRITLDRGAVAKLARQAEMGRYLDGVADQMAKEVTRRAPRWITRAGGMFDGRSTVTAKGYEGQVIVRSSFWHIAEYASGAVRSPQTPFVRPGVQVVLSKVGGRWASA